MTKGRKPDDTSGRPVAADAPGRPVADEEARLWLQSMRDVEPLPGRDEPLPESRPPAKPVKRLAARTTKAPAPPARKQSQPDLSHGTAPGVDKRTATRMKRGQMEIDGRIDLHGLTQDEAHRALVAFIQGAAEAGRRCVLVITGKGSRGASEPGILRSAAPKWLNGPDLRPHVLAFSHAAPKDGGHGALYVLVRRRR
jgi:DNA-nicking Smr family endonuclease